MAPRQPADDRLSATILAGGSGTRFWPLSTEERPKQFLRLLGDRSMLQQTFDRLAGLVAPERTLVLTNERFVGLVREQLPELPSENVIGEPLPRDTAAAVALGAVVTRCRWGDPVSLVLPADHVIDPVDAFQESVRSAASGARSSGALYTFGITPTHPAVGYGYLESGRAIPSSDGVEHFELLRFKEKPDLETAQGYLALGGFLWNSGMFVWRTDAIIDRLRRHLPKHARALEDIAGHDGAPTWADALQSALEPLPKISIDFGVMEKADDVRMVKAPFRWNDVGGWGALQEYLSKDPSGNYVQGDVHGLEASDNLVYCDAADRETVALIGVKDLVVVRAGDRTLVVHKDKLEDVKKLVQSMHEAS